MSSEANSSEIQKDEPRKRRKMSKARLNRRRSSQRPTPSPKVPLGDNEDVESTLRGSSEKLGHSGQKSEEGMSPGVINRAFADLLEEIKEDVVVAKIQDELILSPRLDRDSGDSSPVDRGHKMTYVQTIRGFKSVNENQDTEGHKRTSNTEESNVSLAKSIQRIWISISTICHGLLGGLSVTHLILIWATSPDEWPLAFLKKYAGFAEVFGNTFYFLATICVVSVLDRMDLASFKLNRPRSILWLSILLIYMATIIMSLACDSIDSRLYLGSYNVTIDEDEIRLRKLFSIWNNLSVGRSAGAILGWICLGSVSSSSNDI